MSASSPHSPSWSSASRSWSACQNASADAGFGSPEPTGEVGSIILNPTPGWFEGQARGLMPACTVLIMNGTQQPQQPGPPFLLLSPLTTSLSLVSVRLLGGHGSPQGSSGCITHLYHDSRALSLGAWTSHGTA